MAQTVEVFKEGLIRARDLTEAQTREAQVKETKQRQLDAFIQEFELTVVSVLDGLAAADHAMRGNSRRMSTNAAETREQVTMVAAASEEAMNNVQTVAAAAEQLSISIQEIARQASHASPWRRAPCGKRGSRPKPCACWRTRSAASASSSS